MTAAGYLLASALGLYALGIAAAVALPRKKTPWVVSVFGVLGSGATLSSGLWGLYAQTPFRATLWSVPGIGPLNVAVDPLSAFFLVVTGLIALPAAVFAGGRMGRIPAPSPRYLGVLYLGLCLVIPLILTAGDIFLFLLAWELMSVALYMLVSSGTEHRPGYMMLAVGEAGTLAVLICFLLMGGTTGAVGFDALRTLGSTLGTGTQWAVFLLSFLGFGVKAGLIPLNFWMSRAYTACPDAVMPLVAGATLNLGLYGIIRVDVDLAPAIRPGIGVVLLLAGAGTALLGILYATIEDDFKTLLAHSSMENAGIIATATGACAIFMASAHPVAAAMALTAALYHLLNHSTFKTLLFMGAGVVEEAAGTRSLDRMGSLLRRMPWTGLFVLVGALAISAMPPFNGFVSEWLTIQSLLRSVTLSSLGVKIAFVIAGVGLALTAGLAVTCFVRAFAMAFLGMPRSDAAAQVRETGLQALGPMAFLAVACLVLGVLPTYVVPAADQVVAPLTGASGATALVAPFFPGHAGSSGLPAEFVDEFRQLGAQIGHGALPGRGLVVIHRGGDANPVIFAMSTTYMLVAFVVLLGVSAGLVRLFTGRNRKERRPVWAGGARRFLPEMTYSASGFAQPVRVVFEAILRPRIVDRREAIAEHFRTAIHHQREEVHMIDRLVLLPLSAAAGWIAGNLTRMHSGWINDYAAYALWALVAFLIAASSM